MFHVARLGRAATAACRPRAAPVAAANAQFWQYARSASTATSGDQTFDKILIANRGEIACRIIRTAKLMGVKTVAVYSDQDANSMHVEMADEAHRLGPALSAESYLRMDKIIEVAKRTGAQAIHPGYGFLSENVKFAELCKKEGLVFIGPPVSSIRDMGSKSASKNIMEAANVPCVGGYHGEDQSFERLKAEAGKIGYPVMIKAVLGGGGKGMRICRSEDMFAEMLESSRREAMKSFSDDNVLVEKYIERPRHIEVQVFCDNHGNGVYLYERDCSLQRRHQKIIEEAPAPGLSDEMRRQIGETAVRAAKAVNYAGAGTVEFIVDTSDMKYYFMEMNTRLQVEHCISEMITGTDLVEWQLRVAANQNLPQTQEEIPLKGHSFEARIYAEDPSGGFLPGAGPLKFMQTPEASEHVRVETGVRQGDEISIHYDPMIAKLVVWAPDRNTALQKLRSCLHEYNISGLSTNIDFLGACASHPEFKAGNVSTKFIEDYKDVLFAPRTPEVERRGIAQAVIAMILEETAECQEDGLLYDDPVSPFNNTDAKRLVGTSKRTLTITVGRDETPVQVHVTQKGENLFAVQVGDGLEFDVEAKRQAGKRNLLTRMDGQTFQSTSVVDGRDVRLFSSQDGEFSVEMAAPSYLEELAGGASSNLIKSPMPGAIVKVLVVPGQAVEKNQPLVIMEAMKMEMILRASAAGVVESVNCEAASQVDAGALLVKMADNDAEN